MVFMALCVKKKRMSTLPSIGCIRVFTSVPLFTFGWQQKSVPRKAFVRIITPWPFRSKGYCCCLPVSVPPSACLSVRKLYLVRTITRHRFELESPNWHQTCIMEYSQLVLKMEVIDLDPQNHFGRFDLEFEEIKLVRTITSHRYFKVILAILA